VLLHDRMKANRRAPPSVGTTRSIGLFGIVELVRDREPTNRWRRSRSSPETTALSASSGAGLYTFVRWNTFFTNPPLTISEAELEEASTSSTVAGDHDHGVKQ